MQPFALSSGARPLAQESERDWHLPRFWWAAIFLPLLTFLIVNWVLMHWGGASMQVARPWIPDGHAEAAGRLRTEAAFLLYCGFAVAALAYAAIIVARLSTGSRTAILFAALVSLAVGAALVFAFGLDQGDLYLERDFPCASFDLLPAAKIRSASLASAGRALVPPAVKAKGRPPARTEREQLTCRQGKPELSNLPLYRRAWLPFHVPAARYGQDSYRMLRIMYGLAALILFLGVPPVIWGAVACLALPTTNSVREQYAAWAEQTGRLNRLLYITAGFMIAGLLFTNARMMWPAYSLHPDDLKAFSVHVSSLVLYLGVSNSLLIASYYLPVAAFLARARPRQPALFPATRQSDGGRADAKAPDPWGAFRAAATILSPTLVALIGQLAKFTG